MCILHKSLNENTCFVRVYMKGVERDCSAVGVWVGLIETSIGGTYVVFRTAMALSISARALLKTFEWKICSN